MLFNCLGNDAEICQIAATDGKDDFNVYVVPKHGISAGASAVNKLTVQNGILFYNGRPVSAVGLTEAVSKLLDWLKTRKPCVLLAHNGKAFDAKHLMKAWTTCGSYEEYCNVVMGFSDTFLVFRELYPDRQSCSQESLVTDLLGSTYSAHNALADVHMLQKLTSELVSDSCLLKHSFSLSWLHEYYEFLDKKRANLRSLQPAIQSKAISKGMAEKVASSGLTLAHLQLAFQRSGTDGLSNVLTERFHGKPRVTSNKRIVANICSFIQN